MKKLTSFTKLTTGEGMRISFTYSEIDDSGNLTSQNNKKSFIAVDEGVIAQVQAIEQYINANHLEG